MPIKELLDMPAQKRPDKENRADIDGNKGIEFDKVSFSYHDGNEVLHNISFETKPGEVTALVGPVKYIERVGMPDIREVMNICANS